MNRITNILFCAVLCSSATAQAHEFSVVNGPAGPCYARAMIGFDSVINSRVGVPAEHALKLARLDLLSPQKVYSKTMLNTIWNAYLWHESPHTYAINVFFSCAQEKEPLQSATTSPSDWIVAAN